MLTLNCGIIPTQYEEYVLSSTSTFGLNIRCVVGFFLKTHSKLMHRFYPWSSFQAAATCSSFFACYNCCLAHVLHFLSSLQLDFLKFLLYFHLVSDNCCCLTLNTIFYIKETQNIKQKQKNINISHTQFQLLMCLCQSVKLLAKYFKAVIHFFYFRWVKVTVIECISATITSTSKNMYVSYTISVLYMC